MFTHGLCLEDNFNDTVKIQSRDQDFSDVPLYINNLKHYDGINGRRVSEFEITNLDHTITGKRTFSRQPIIAANATQREELVTNHYVDIGLTCYRKTDGSNQMLGQIKMENRRITSLGYGLARDNTASVQNLNVGLARKPNIDSVILRDGTQSMEGNLNLFGIKLLIPMLPAVSGGGGECSK